MIIDASAMIELLLRTDKAARIERHVSAASAHGLDAPHLIDIEVAQVLRRFVSRGEMTTDRAALALQALVQFPLRRHPHAALLLRVWQWRDNLSAYDAAYVALAETLQTSLVTCDTRLAKAAGALVEVLVV